MSRFYLDKSYIPQVQKMLDKGASVTEISMRIGFCRESVKKFIKKHELVKTLRIRVAI